MADKKVFQNNDQRIKIKLDGGAIVNVIATSIYREINSQMFYEDGKPRLENFDEGWTNLVAYGGSIIKHIGIKPVVCKWSKKNFMTDLHS